MAKRTLKIGDKLLNELRVRARSEAVSRNRSQVEKGILSDGKFAQLYQQAQQQGFVDVMKTTLGNAFSQQGLLRNIQVEDLEIFNQKITDLERRGAFKEGITAREVINASLAVDRSRASSEIPWSHPIASRYLAKGANKTLVVTFTTAASGRNGANKHFVNVEFLQFKETVTHRLMTTPSKDQAIQDAQKLKDGLLKFDCDCGRHTYWYRFIASKGKFAYIGSNPLGREETGFPKIRNPQLKGIACKHVLRTMQSLLNEKGTEQFIVKAIMKQYGKLDSKKDVTTQTTKRDFEQALKRQNKQVSDILSDSEKNLAPKLLARYRESLNNGFKQQTRNVKDRRTAKERLAYLKKLQHL